jgi:hypothetical protein
MPGWMKIAGILVVLAVLSAVVVVPLGVAAVVLGVMAWRVGRAGGLLRNWPSWSRNALAGAAVACLVGQVYIGPTDTSGDTEPPKDAEPSHSGGSSSSGTGGDCPIDYSANC